MQRRGWWTVGLGAAALTVITGWAFRSSSRVPDRGPEPTPPVPIEEARNELPPGARRFFSPERPIVPGAARMARQGMRVSGGIAGTDKERALIEQGLVGPTNYSVDERGVLGAIASRRAGVTSCWRAAFAHDPVLEGDRILTLEIAPDGDGPATIHSLSSGADVLDTCLHAALHGIGFTAHAPITVQVPLSAPTSP